MKEGCRVPTPGKRPKMLWADPAAFKKAAKEIDAEQDMLPF
jgi:hypothetical protein